MPIPWPCYVMVLICVYRKVYFCFIMQEIQMGANVNGDNVISGHKQEFVWVVNSVNCGGIKKSYWV